jgi:hypothetical protein
MSTPEAHDPERVDNWCSIAPKPHLMTGFLREWLIHQFAGPETLEHKSLRNKIWAAMPDTRIVIESITQWDPTKTQKRPAVILKRNDWTVERISIDDRRHGTIPYTGARYYNVLVRGSHTLFCLAGAGTEAEILAAEVYGNMLKFGPWIRQQASLMRFAVAGCGSIFEVEEAHEHYAVPVTVGYVAQESWMLVPQAPVLKRVVLSHFIP